ncbi:MAG TPA: polyphosphate kinase 2 family protein, partial [Vitreimonas sp.]|nr:polyphosphate kinase 2 family protein [Vitreimonas sp.]
MRLSDIDPGETFGRDKVGARTELDEGLARLRDLQERLWAEQRHKVLVVLQGIDAAGKGGTIEHVMGAMNPAGCPVTSFKAPTAPELAHDYLWRIHQRTPATGEIAIFDRSHYEDVLVVRVHELVPRDRWELRYEQINAFERMLAEEGTTILKLFLWISREEQAERLRARYADPTKRWKFRLGDLDERRRWDDYVVAFEEALSRCSTDTAPWYVIPANRKWFRNLAVAEILADTIAALDPQYPEPEDLPV